MFVIKVPKEKHTKFVEALSKMEHVKMSDDSKSGTLSMKGGEITFKHVGEDVIECSVTKNSLHLPEGLIAAAVKADVAIMMHVL